MDWSPASRHLEKFCCPGSPRPDLKKTRETKDRQKMAHTTTLPWVRGLSLPLDLGVGQRSTPFYSKKFADGISAEEPGKVVSSALAKGRFGHVLVQDSASTVRAKTSWTANPLGLPNASGTLVFHLDRPTCRTACDWRSQGFQSRACHSGGRSPDASRRVLSQSPVDRV